MTVDWNDCHIAEAATRKQSLKTVAKKRAVANQQHEDQAGNKIHLTARVQMKGYEPSTSLKPQEERANQQY